LDTTLTFRFNELTHSIDQSFVLDGETIRVAFSNAELAGATPFIQFSGTDVRLNVADVVELRGDATLTWPRASSWSARGMCRRCRPGRSGRVTGAKTRMRSA
jgi:hypothetical protein